MAKDNEIQLGEIALFHSDKKGVLTRADMEGKMKTPKGEYYVKLWLEKNQKVTGGEFLKGYVYSIKPE